MIINRGALATLYTGYKASFQEGFRGAEPHWEKVATRIASTTGREEYGWLGQYPRLREWAGDRVVKNITRHSYAIVNRKFESTIAVARDDIEDDNVGIYAPLFQEMGFAAATHPDELVFGLLKQGFDLPCYDGQNFFDADHPVLVDGVETSVSNLQAGTQAPWFLLDTRRALKPLIFQIRRDYALHRRDAESDDNVFDRDEFVYGIDARVAAGFGFWQQAFGSKAALDKANLRAARQAMLALKSDEGRPLGILPNLLVVGLANESQARDLILSEHDAAGASNPDYKLVDLLVVPWLD